MGTFYTEESVIAFLKSNPQLDSLLINPEQKLTLKYVIDGARVSIECDKRKFFVGITGRIENMDIDKMQEFYDYCVAYLTKILSQ